MKKTYETPSVEKIAFNYRDQVVVASGGSAEQNKGDLIPGWKVGDITNEQWLSNGCKYYSKEAEALVWCYIV